MLININNLTPLDLYMHLTSFKDNHNSVFKLRSPKIIIFNPSANITKLSKVEVLSNLETISQDIDDKNNNGRNDRKYKNQVRPTDTLDTKKNKIKKKSRPKISLTDHEDSLNDTYIDANNHSSDIALSMIRPKKSPKARSQDRLAYTTQYSSPKKKNVQKVTSEDLEIKDTIEIDKKISIDHPLTISELGSLLNIVETELIKKLFLQGICVTINQTIDISIATALAKNYGFEIIQNHTINSQVTKRNSKSQLQIKNENGTSRKPVISIFGHVDHGKTTLLDAIRDNKAGTIEAGGITQNIRADEIQLNNSGDIHEIVLLDTPGHEAFSSMRIRCLEITDIAILVVAVDDGIQPQTLEAIRNLEIYQIPLIIALNKVDKADINIQNIKQQLANENILSEEWGGNIPFVEISALQRLNIHHLVNEIIKLSMKHNKKVLHSGPASGTILDAHLDKYAGPVATIIIQNGELRPGDFILANQFNGRIRAIIDTKKQKLAFAGPSSIVNVWGFNEIPLSGIQFETSSDEKDFKKVNVQKDHSNLYINPNNNHKKQINFILKTDTQGSVEAITHILRNIPQEKVQLNLISQGLGEITERDIQLALISKSEILGFNTFINNNITNTAEQKNIKINTFNVIYDLNTYVRNQMLQLIDLEYKEEILGNAIVEHIFTLSKGSVAGCIVQSGKLIHNSHIKVYRNQQLIYEGKLDSLKHLKEDVDQVDESQECGILSIPFSLWQKKDIIEAYTMIPQEKTL